MTSSRRLLPLSRFPDVPTINPWVCIFSDICLHTGIITPLARIPVRTRSRTCDEMIPLRGTWSLSRPSDSSRNSSLPHREECGVRLTATGSELHQDLPQVLKEDLRLPGAAPAATSRAPVPRATRLPVPLVGSPSGRPGSGASTGVKTVRSVWPVRPPPPSHASLPSFSSQPSVLPCHSICSLQGPGTPSVCTLALCRDPRLCHCVWICSVPC